MKQPRHFEPGMSGRPARETYRIDHTSCDGSGLVADDGNQRHEGQREMPSPIDNVQSPPNKHGG
jgi:hypothetical protein